MIQLAGVDLELLHFVLVNAPSFGCPGDEFLPAYRMTCEQLDRTIELCQKSDIQDTALINALITLYREARCA